MSLTGFSSRPPVQARPVGRGLRIVLGVILILVACGFLGHIWFSKWWSSGEEEDEGIIVKPAAARIEKYVLPQPEVVHASLPVVKQEPQPEKRSEERQPRIRKATMEQRERPDPIRLGDVAWNVAVEVSPASFFDGRQTTHGIGCSLRLGQSMIPIVLIDAIFSEIGGQVIAQVSSPIYSVDVGYENKVLVPKGTRIVGEVVGTKELTIDRGRLEVVWTKMSNPLGFGGDQRYTEVALGDALGASADGSGGFGGEVEYQLGTTFAYAALVTLFNVAQRQAFEDNEYADEAASTMGQIGNEIVEQSFQWRPKIAVDQGSPGQVKIQKTTRVC